MGEECGEEEVDTLERGLCGNGLDMVGWGSFVVIPALGFVLSVTLISSSVEGLCIGALLQSYCRRVKKKRTIYYP